MQAGIHTQIPEYKHLFGDLLPSRVNAAVSSPSPKRHITSYYGVSLCMKYYAIRRNQFMEPALLYIIIIIIIIIANYYYSVRTIDAIIINTHPAWKTAAPPTS